MPNSYSQDVWETMRMQLVPFFGDELQVVIPIIQRVPPLQHRGSAIKNEQEPGAASFHFGW